MELYSRCIWHLYGNAFQHLSLSLPPSPTAAVSSVQVTGTVAGAGPGDGKGKDDIRLGVVSEHHSNSSPGLCLEVRHSISDLFHRLGVIALSFFLRQFSAASLSVQMAHCHPSPHVSPPLTSYSLIDST
jgi:hypothetical protein